MARSRARRYVFTSFDTRNRFPDWYNARIRRFQADWTREWTMRRPWAGGLSWQEAYGNALRNPYGYHETDAKVHMKKLQRTTEKLEQDRVNALVGGQIIRQFQDKGLPMDVIDNIIEFVGDAQ